MRLLASRLMACAVPAAMLAFTGTMQASIVNGGFETGDFTGWTTFGPAGVGSGTWLDGIHAPTEGSYYAGIESGLGVGVYSLVSQSFSVSAGQTLSGDWFFQTNDYLPYDDGGYLRILDSSDAVVATLLIASVSTVGDYGHTLWLPWTHTFSASGSGFKIEAGVTNSLDNGVESRVGIDNVHLTIIPLPPAALAGLIGLAGVAGFGVIRRRQVVRARD